MFHVLSKPATELLRIAQALIAQGETQRARLLLQSIADLYPGDEAATEAGHLLRELPH